MLFWANRGKMGTAIVAAFPANKWWNDIDCFALFIFLPYTAWALSLDYRCGLCRLSTSRISPIDCIVGCAASCAIWLRFTHFSLSSLSMFVFLFYLISVSLQICRALVPSESVYHIKSVLSVTFPNLQYSLNLSLDSHDILALTKTASLRSVPVCVVWYMIMSLMFHSLIVLAVLW